MSGQWTSTNQESVNDYLLFLGKYFLNQLYFTYPIPVRPSLVNSKCSIPLINLQNSRTGRLHSSVTTMSDNFSNFGGTFWSASRIIIINSSIMPIYPQGIHLQKALWLGRKRYDSMFLKTWLMLGTSCNHFASLWKYQLVAALCAVMAGSLKETLLANLRDVPCFEIQFAEKNGRRLPMISRYIDKLNLFHMFAFLTRNAWKSLIIWPISFIFLLA